MRLNRFALTEFRIRSGFTKAHLATEIGISPGHMHDLESGRRDASPVVLDKLAGALKVPIPALLSSPESSAS